MKTCNTAHEHLVSDILSRELGSNVTLVPVPTYPDTIVYEANAESGRFVFKAIDPDGQDRDGIALEAWTCEKARDVGVPAPRVVTVETNRTRFPSSFFIMERATGEPMEGLTLSEDQETRLLNELGSHLSALHRIKIPGFGWLDEGAFASSGTVRGSADTWRLALLDEVPRSLEYLSEAGRLTQAEVDEVQRAIEAGAEIIEGCRDGRLLHGDIGLLHVWVDPDELRVTSVLDWGERSSGDPASDFGDLEGRQLHSVLTGYGADEADGLAQRIRFYALVRAIPWARRWHSRGETQVLDWVRHVLQRVS
jgi:aminoglycoside phosphotransferase (APT) family kinase protein